MSNGWRSLEAADIDALRALARACDGAFGTDEEQLVEHCVALLDRNDRASRTMARDDAQGLAAAGWIDWHRSGERRTLLRAFVREDARALEDELVTLLHERARRMFVAEPAEGSRWVRADRVLRGVTASLPRDTLVTYGRLGLAFFYVEHELHRALDSAPEAVAPPSNVRIAPWTPERDADIRAAYNDAFADRGFDGYSEDEWATGPFSGQESFRPDLSYLALESHAICGFVLCTVEDETVRTGWIDTVGVCSRARGRGIAEALLEASLKSMHRAGLGDAVLRVNDNNGRARRVFDRLGFATVRKHVVYRQAV